MASGSFKAQSSSTKTMLEVPLMSVLMRVLMKLLMRVLMRMLMME